MVTELGAFEFNRCPVGFRVAGALRLVEMEKEGALKAAYETKVRWPAKRLAGLMYVEYLRELRKASNGDRA